jgi:hypothetical protein
MLQLMISTNHEANQIVRTMATPLSTEKISVATQLATYIHELRCSQDLTVTTQKFADF